MNRFKIVMGGIVMFSVMLASSGCYVGYPYGGGYRGEYRTYDRDYYRYDNRYDRNDRPGDRERYSH
jgi:hypothetical protein